jgi:5-methylcytosine-specific restriction endonuclease McrA
MPGSSTQRNTTTRDRHRAVIRRGRPPCHLCGDDIDYALRSPDLMSFEVDHIIPLARGGSDELDNKAASHRKCNQEKAAHLAEEIAAAVGPRGYVTSRTW